MPPDNKQYSGWFNTGVFSAILLTGLLLYIPPLQSKTFYFDDYTSVETNRAIRGLDIPVLFDAFNTRTLVGISFALNYKWCGLNPFGFRLINLLIHCLNAFLVYLLIKSTLYLYAARKTIFHCPLEWPAFFGSMLFLCHPLQTEPVNFITQRFALMGTCFYLLTLFLYIKYRSGFQKRYLVAVLFSAVAAMFCKEFVITLPVMLALYDFYFLGEATVLKRCQFLLPFFAIALIVPILLLRTPSGTIGVANIADSNVNPGSSAQAVEKQVDITRARNSVGRKEYFLTELNVLCTYIRLMFVPVNQNLDYDYPVSYQVDIKTACCGLLLLGLIGLAVALYKSYRLISFSIWWFFIALSVESSFIPIGDLITEYRPYLAGAGFVLLVTTLIYSRKADIKVLNVIAVVIIAVFSYLTFQRNIIWKDEFTLWNDTVGKSPHKARPYNNRGNACIGQGNVTQAMADFNKAIELNPDYISAHYNRGVLYGKQDNLGWALADYDKVIELNPRYEEAYNNRGTIYVKQGQLDRAGSDFSKAIEIAPEDEKAYYNRASNFAQQGRLAQARADFNKAIELNPLYAEAYNNRGSVFNKEGDYARAISDYNRAVELDPGYAQAFINRGFVEENQGDSARAISDYNKAIGINPVDAKPYNNRGIIYAKQGDLAGAMADYNKAIALDPHFALAFSNRGLIDDRQRNAGQSILDFDQAIKIDPDLADAYFNRGVVYAKQGHLDQAMLDFTRAIGINPGYAQAYNNRGSTYYEQGNFIQAAADYNKAIEINPRFADAYKNAAVSYYQLKDYDKALSSARKAMELGADVNSKLLSALEGILVNSSK